MAKNTDSLTFNIVPSRMFWISFEDFSDYIFYLTNLTKLFTNVLLLVSDVIVITEWWNNKHAVEDLFELR